jgi:hypothetical protein
MRVFLESMHAIYGPTAIADALLASIDAESLKGFVLDLVEREPEGIQHAAIRLSVLEGRLEAKKPKS